MFVLGMVVGGLLYSMQMLFNVGFFLQMKDFLVRKEKA